MHDHEQQQQPPTWPPTWSKEARSFYGIGDQKRLDKRDFKKGPQLQEEARVVAARLHHASNELQLRIESRRFETAQLQLQVQVEKTSTAKAQLAVEKARNRAMKPHVHRGAQGKFSTGTGEVQAPVHVHKGRRFHA